MKRKQEKSRIRRKKKKEMKKRKSHRKRKEKKAEPSRFLINALSAVNSNQLDVAVDILRAGIDEDKFAAYCGIGDIFILQGRYEEALEWLNKARECEPHSTKAVSSVAKALDGLGRRDEAVTEMMGVLKRQKDMLSAHSLIETLLKMDAGDAVIELLETKQKKDNSRVDVLLELAKIFKLLGAVNKAEEFYKKSLEYYSDASIYNELGQICQLTGHLADSEKYLLKGIDRYPSRKSRFSVNLVNTLIQAGRTAEGVKLLKEVVEDLPKHALPYSNLLLYLHYLAEIDSDQLFVEHKRWAKRHASEDKCKIAHNNSPEPERKLRIGYVSSDFRMHSVTYFFEPLVDRHNRSDFEIFGYGNISNPDQTTERLKGKFEACRNLYGLDDASVARMIASDKIDILVDLSGHTAGNRLGAFAYKPAPIQVTYLGYPDTTGMEQIDYRLTDMLSDPPESERFYTEELAYLPESFLCYRGPDFAPEVVEPPVVKNGYITFGSFNNNSKINKTVMELWARILKENQDSRFLLKFRGGDEESVKKYYLNWFERLGIAAERVEIVGRKSAYEHLKLYEQMDIALDTYPYNGTTTTLEAMWMGVPIITLLGRHHMSRVGFSIMSNLGLDFFVARDSQGYVSKACELANDIESLKNIRKTFRSHLSSSALCDEDKFTQELEMLYRKMWQRWCQGRVSQANNITASSSQSPGNTAKAGAVEINKKKELNRPTVRILHNLARAGGTLVSKCLGCMDRIVLLSEIHPQGGKYFNPVTQAHQWHKLLNAEDREKLKEAKNVDFTDGIKLIQSRCRQRGDELVIRDWGHLDFMAVPFLARAGFRSLLADALGAGFELRRISLVRHPVDEWLSLSKLAVVQGKLSLEMYLRGYLHFAKQGLGTGFVRYEDFTREPVWQMKVICEKLQLPFDESFMEKWYDYKKVTGDTSSQSRGAKLRRIQPLARQPVSPELLEKFRNNDDYWESLKLLGYSDSEGQISSAKAKTVSVSGEIGENQENSGREDKKSALKASRIFVSCMPRSGSMWAYNVTRELIRSAGVEPIPQKVPPDATPYLTKAFEEPVGENQAYCIKTHYPVDPEKPDTLIINTYRDIRDAVISQMRFMHLSFEEAFGDGKKWMRLTDMYSDGKSDNILQICYERIVTEPMEVIRRIDRFIGTEASEQRMEEIQEQFSKEKIKRKIDDMKGISTEQILANASVMDGIRNADGSYRVFDRNTGFQSNHITSQRDGQWREALTEQQQQYLAESTAEWLTRYGFEL